MFSPVSPRDDRHSVFSTILGALTRANRRLEERLGFENRNIRDEYRDTLGRLSSDRTLHLGSGRDKHGITDTVAGSVVSLDPDQAALADIDHDGAAPVRGDATSLPLADQSVDLVACEYVFEHLPEPEAALDEIDRVLRPGGSVVILVPNPIHYYALVADHTPFWFHRLWLRLMGHSDVERDAYPTQYAWGTLADIRRAADRRDWTLRSLDSQPGPTGYTQMLPIHAVFVLIELVIARFPRLHLNFLVHYEKD